MLQSQSLRAASPDPAGIGSLLSDYSCQPQIIENSQRTFHHPLSRMNHFEALDCSHKKSDWSCLKVPLIAFVLLGHDDTVALSIIQKITKSKVPSKLCPPQPVQDVPPAFVLLLRIATIKTIGHVFNAQTFNDCL